MDAQGSFIAEILDASSKALAAGVVVRQQGETASAAGGFDDLVADTQVRLRYLSESLAAGHAEVFVDYVEWLRASYTTRGVPLDILEENLRCMRAELDEVLPKDTRAEVDRRLDAALASLAETPPELESLLEEEAPHVDLARKFVLAILEGHRSHAIELVTAAAANGASPSDIQVHVVAKAQAEMGRMWQRGEVHVGEEHLGSHVVEEVLTRMRARIPEPAADARCVIAASVSGNRHDIGARMVADHFVLAGWRALFLGADMPPDDLIRAIGDFRADLLALSVTQGTELRATAGLIERVRGELGSSAVPVLVGGPPFRAIPELWRAVGADGCAVDAPGAVQVGERLVG